MTVTAKQRQSARPPAPSGARGSVSGVRSVSARPVSANAFPKSARLLKHAGFQHVYETGRKQFSGNMIFFYLLKEGAPPLSPAVGDRVGIQKTQQFSVQVGLTVGRALGGS